jgi:hypothetical protein
MRPLGRDGDGVVLLSEVVCIHPLAGCRVAR